MKEKITMTYDDYVCKEIPGCIACTVESSRNMEKSERDNDLCSAKEHGKKWVDNYEEYQNACNTHTETYTTSNGMIGIVR